ncbi:polysaccharide biosynthesis/export family protein [Lacisediminimonas sp.]|uniref:polysaccharide biosynthesis/export family protein n=1 Tax=Lacisediminimonas sp. TaxID=3060582 RepID=UPI00271B2D49|nr:polysaccharide biosynthesis/export family protein [Lacisediminimonas sp.]MDO8299446.1 polysaccharide biosynthesis/export family protein [Lacisediminimonas sp.]
MKWSVMLLAPVMSACISSPGMPKMSSGYSSSADNAGAGTDAAVPTLIKQITPTLVKSERSRRDQQRSQDLSSLLGKPGAYSIEPGDILSIVVWDHPELNVGAAIVPAGAGADQAPGATPVAGFIVDHQGAIQFPYAGVIKVSGMTQEQARHLLAERLSKYIRNPNVTLRVQSYRSKRVYVDGEVKAPGLQAINDIPMTLMEAINRSGGFLPAADQSQIHLTRGGETFHINLPQLVQKGMNPNNIMLANGDVVRVVSRDSSKVFVSGEVIQPRALPMINGRLTLNEALGESGGINPLSGDAKQIYVVRKSATEPVVYQLNAEENGALALAESFELEPKDIVYVAATALTNWHRTISQILPGALSAAVGAAKPPTGY